MSQSVPLGSARTPKKTTFSVILHFWLPAVVVLLFVFQRPVLADTLYTYTGNDFTNFLAPAGNPQVFDTSNFISVSFTVAEPLECPTFCSISPITLFMSIGGSTPGSLQDVAVTFTPFEVQTNSYGAIVAWDVEGCIALFESDGFSCEDRFVGTTGISDSAELGNFMAFNQNDPGVWTITSVPEPSTFATVASGLALLVGVVRRRWS